MAGATSSAGPADLPKLIVLRAYSHYTRPAKYMTMNGLFPMSSEKGYDSEYMRPFDRRVLRLYKGCSRFWDILLTTFQRNKKRIYILI